MIDLFQQAGLDPVGVLIHDGDKASHEAERGADYEFRGGEEEVEMERGDALR